MTAGIAKECRIAYEISQSTIVRFGQAQEIAGSVFGIAFLLYYVVHPEKMPRMPQGEVKVSQRYASLDA